MAYQSVSCVYYNKCIFFWMTIKSCQFYKPKLFEHKLLQKSTNITLKMRWIILSSNYVNKQLYNKNITNK